MSAPIRKGHASLAAITLMTLMLAAAPAASSKDKAEQSQHQKAAERQRGEAPARENQQPAREGQKPAREGQKPARAGQKPPRTAPQKRPSPAAGSPKTQAGARATANASSGGDPAPAPSRHGRAGRTQPDAPAATDVGTASPTSAGLVAAPRGASIPAPAAAPAALNADSPEGAVLARRTRGSRTRRTAARRGRGVPSPVRPAPAAPFTPRPSLEAPPALASTAAPSRPARPREPAEEPRGEAFSLPPAITRIIEVIPDSLLALVGLLGVLTLGFGAVSAITGRRAHRLERERRRLSADVGLLQSALLPELPERVGAASVSASYRPAGGGSAAGGGFYDAFALPDGRTGILVGAIRGAGREALALTTLVRYTLRTHLENGLEPRAALQAADAALLHQMRGKLAQAAAGIFDPTTGYLTYACAGHAQPVILGDDQAPVDALEAPPLGSGHRTGGRQTAVGLGPGRAAVFHSLEADEPLMASLTPEAGAAEILATLGARDRDVTVLVLRPHPEATEAPPTRHEELEVRGADWMGAGAFLEACGVDPDEASLVLHEARETIVRTGAALLETSRDGTRVRVSVEGARSPAPRSAQRLASVPGRGQGAGRWASADRRSLI